MLNVLLGEIDEETLKLMNAARCGVADKLGTSRLGNKRVKRFSLQGTCMLCMYLFIRW